MKLASTVAALALIAGLGLAPVLSSAPAYAVDNMTSTDAPDLTSVRAKIKAKDYAAALAELRELAEDVQHADVYNLLGFTLRKTGDFKTSLTYYTKAIETAAGPQGRPRISRRALCRNRQHGEGQGAARRSGKTLPRRLRGARGSAKGDQRQIGQQLTAKRSGRPRARFFSLGRYPFRRTGFIRASFGDQSAMRDDIVLLVSRLLLAWIFLHEGAFLLVNYSASSAGMAKMGVPAFAPPLVIALQLIAGAAIAVGWYARCGAAALGLFCLATAFLFHTNFAVRNELLHFEKDLAIAGGMFVLMVCGAGRWSVDVRCGRSMGT